MVSSTIALSLVAVAASAWSLVFAPPTPTNEAGLVDEARALVRRSLQAQIAADRTLTLGALDCCARGSYLEQWSQRLAELRAGHRYRIWTLDSLEFVTRLDRTSDGYYVLTTNERWSYAEYDTSDTQRRTVLGGATSIVSTVTYILQRFADRLWIVDAAY